MAFLFFNFRSMSLSEALANVGELKGVVANTLKLDALPTFYKNGADPQSIINEVITELTKTRPEGASRARLNEDALIATICRQAVAAGKPLHDLERQTLIRQLLACEMPTAIPKAARP